MQGEIVVPNRKDIEKMTETEGQSMALEIRDKLIQKGIGSDYIVEKIDFLLENCWIVNNQGHKYLDAKSYLETLKFITKLHGVKITEAGAVQIAFFNGVAKDKEGRINF